jgi:maleate cis-trans isomerase
MADIIPYGNAAAILVIGHHWATRLRDAIAKAGSFFRL